MDATLPPDTLDVGELFEAHGAFVRRVAQRLVGCAALADDVAQEVFVLAIRSRHDLLSRIGIRTWLYRATVNKAREGFRSDRRYRDALARMGRIPEVESTSPERVLDRAMSGRRIRACVARLSDSLREVFVLYELEQLEGAEIALILEIPLNTVWSKLRLARAAFRELWSTLPENTP